MTHWTAGWNMPGYLPETEPAPFLRWHDAHRYIVETVERFWHEDAVVPGHEDDQWLDVHTTLHHVREGWAYSVPSARLVFWVAPCPECAADAEGICPDHDALAGEENDGIWVEPLAEWERAR
jgi:hypothetical protein